MEVPRCSHCTRVGKLALRRSQVERKAGLPIHPVPGVALQVGIPEGA